MPKMLIVDDEPDICGCLQDFFSAKGFDVRTAFSGGQAMEALVGEGRPDVVLLDLRLPDAWGIDILKRVKRLYPATKVIIVSSMDQPESQQEARTYGAIGYVTKPFDFSDTTWAPVLSKSG